MGTPDGDTRWGHPMGTLDARPRATAGGRRLARRQPQDGFVGRVSPKGVPEGCPRRVSPKGVPEGCPRSYAVSACFSYTINGASFFRMQSSLSTISRMFLCDGTSYITFNIAFSRMARSPR